MPRNIAASRRGEQCSPERFYAASHCHGRTMFAPTATAWLRVGGRRCGVAQRSMPQWGIEPHERASFAGWRRSLCAAKRRRPVQSCAIAIYHCRRGGFHIRPGTLPLPSSIILQYIFSPAAPGLRPSAPARYTPPAPVRRAGLRRRTGRRCFGAWALTRRRRPAHRR